MMETVQMTYATQMELLILLENLNQMIISNPGSKTSQFLLLPIHNDMLYIIVISKHLTVT